MADDPNISKKEIIDLVKNSELTDDEQRDIILLLNIGVAEAKHFGGLTPNSVAGAVRRFLRQKEPADSTTAGAADAHSLQEQLHVMQQQLHVMQQQLHVMQQQYKEHVQLAATTAAYKVVSGFKRQRLSVTAYADIGDELLNITKHVKPDLLPRTNAQFPHDIIDSTFKRGWEKIVDAGGVQEHLKELFQAIRKQQNGRTQSRFVLDTHSKSFYTQPTAKVDLSLSASKEAFWATAESFTELKYRIHGTDEYNSAVGQVYTCAQHMFDAQPQRDYVIQCIAGKDAVELWQFERHGNVLHSGWEPLDWVPSSSGYQLLMSYLHAAAADLGYTPTTPLQGFSVKLLDGPTVLLDSCTPMANIPNRRLVYKASYVIKDGPASAVVVKFGTEKQIKHELMIMRDPQLKGTGMPQVLAVGEVSCLPREIQRLAGDLDHYYVMEPFGAHITADHLPRLKLSALLGVCDVLERLLAQKYLHRDISPDNIVVAKVEREWRGYLLDFHVAALQDAQQNPPLTGKPHYWSLKLHAAKREKERLGAFITTPCHTEQTDVESLFYTLLDWAGEGLPWRNVSQEEDVHDMKFRRMFSTLEWQRTLDRCDKELQPVLALLHAQIFGKSEAEYVKHSVTIQNVRSIVQPAYEQLLKEVPELDDALVPSQPDCGFVHKAGEEGGKLAAAGPMQSD